MAGLKVGEVLTEDDDVTGAGRVANERTALAFADRGVRTMSFRFAPTVHGRGDSGFVALVVAADRAHGRAGLVGDGTNRWPAAHRSDVARLVRLGVENAPAGSILHGVGEEGVVLKDVAAAIGAGLALPVKSLTPDQAQDQFGFLADVLALDTPASSSATQQLLDWHPTGPGLIDDIASGAYFDAAQ